MNTQTFFYDCNSERYCVGSHQLHCGDCFILYAPAGRKEVRIEHSRSCGGWYLVGAFPAQAENYEGCKASMYDR